MVVSWDLRGSRGKLRVTTLNTKAVKHFNAPGFDILKIT